MQFQVNGQSHTLDAPPDTPLLWVLRDVLHMTGTKFGCGVGLCGACTVHVDGEAVRACLTPASTIAGRKITTIEAMASDAVGKAAAVSMARHRRAAMRLLPGRTDHVRRGAAQAEAQTTATPTSTPR